MNSGRAFEENVFLGEANKFVGSGGELLVKAETKAPATRIDVGDRLIGIGVTHYVESLERAPGLDSFRAISPQDEAKFALRGFEVVTKERTPEGFNFRFGPLAPSSYNATLRAVSEGAVDIPASSIPDGTIILSFLDPEPTYTLQTIDGSPGENWVRAAKGRRHWNVGFSNDSDFWAASFPSDDIGLLTQLPPATRVGTIQFGLSLLRGSETALRFNRIQAFGPSGAASSHDFVLHGSAAGTQGLRTPFPIGLRTEITFHPNR